MIFGREPASFSKACNPDSALFPTLGNSVKAAAPAQVSFKKSRRVVTLFPFYCKSAAGSLLASPHKEKTGKPEGFPVFICLSWAYTQGHYGVTSASILVTF